MSKAEAAKIVPEVAKNEQPEISKQEQIERERAEKLRELKEEFEAAKLTVEELADNERYKKRLEWVNKNLAEGIDRAARGETNTVPVDELERLVFDVQKEGQNEVERFQNEKGRQDKIQDAKEVEQLLATYHELDNRDSKNGSNFDVNTSSDAEWRKAFNFAVTSDPSHAPFLKEHLIKWRNEGLEGESLKNKLDTEGFVIFKDSVKKYANMNAEPQLRKPHPELHNLHGPKNSDTQFEAEYLYGAPYQNLAEGSEQQKQYQQQVKAELENDPQLMEIVSERYLDELSNKKKDGVAFKDWNKEDQLNALADKYATQKKLYILPAEEGLVHVGSRHNKMEKYGVLPIIGPEGKAENKEKKGKKIYMVDITEVAKRMAWTKGEEILRAKYEKSNFIGKAWRSLAENHYRVKFYQQALEEIQQDNNLMKAIEGRLTGEESPDGYVPSDADYFRVLDSVVEQFDAELVDKNLEEGDQIQDANVSAQAAALFRLHASGDWSQMGPEYQNLTERERVELYVKNEITPLVADNDWGGEDQPKKGWFNRGKSKTNKGVLYASNFWNLAEEYKNGKSNLTAELAAEYPEQKEAIEKHLAGLENLDIQLGFKQRDLVNNRPKNVLGIFEKMQDFAEGNTVLGRILANPVTYGILGALGTRAAQRGAKWALTGGAAAGMTAAGIGAFPVLLPLLVGAGIGAAYKYAKRSKDIKYDVAQEQRNETLGGDNSELLDKSNGRLITLSYDDAIATLRSIEANPDSLNDAATQEQLAELLAMRDLEKNPIDGKNYDLFHLSQEEGERFGTNLVAQTELDRLLKSVSGTGENQEYDLQSLVDQARGDLSAEISAMEVNINSFRRKESLKSAAWGAVLGTAAGLAAQEGVYRIGRWASDYLGTDYFNNHQTAGEHIWDQISNYYNGSGETTAALVTESSAGSNTRAWEHLTTLNHEDWHDEVGRGGVRNLLFEGKQQQMDLHYDKTNDSVTFSMSRMLKGLAKNLAGEGKAGVNWDKSVDSKMAHILQEMRGHQSQGNLMDHFKVRIFPENGQSGYVVDARLDDNGQLVFSGEERNLLFDAKGKQLAKFIEIGYTDDEGGYHTMATSVGKGVHLPEAAPVPITEPVVPPEKVPDFPVPLVPPSRKVWGRGKNGEPEPEEQLTKGDKAPAPKPQGKFAQAREKLGEKINQYRDRKYAQNQKKLWAKYNPLGVELSKAQESEVPEFKNIKSVTEARSLIGLREAEWTKIKKVLPNFEVSPKLLTEMKTLTAQEQLGAMRKMAEVMRIVNPDNLGDNKILFSLEDSPSDGVLEINLSRSPESARGFIEGYLRKQRRQEHELEMAEESPEAQEENNLDQIKPPRWVTNKDKWKHILDTEKGVLKETLDRKLISNELAQGIEGFLIEGKISGKKNELTPILKALAAIYKNTTDGPGKRQIDKLAGEIAGIAGKPFEDEKADLFEQKKPTRLGKQVKAKKKNRRQGQFRQGNQNLSNVTTT